MAFTSILSLNTATEDTNQVLSNMCSSCEFVYLLAPIFSVKQFGQKQLFSYVVHLNQRTSDPYEEDNFLPFS